MTNNQIVMLSIGAFIGFVFLGLAVRFSGLL